MLTQDDTYKGYILPKGTILFANTWSIHRTADFDDPEAFKPGRWANSTFGTRDTSVDDEKRRPQYGFGAGRRICQGQRLAENSLVQSPLCLNVIALD